MRTVVVVQARMGSTRLPGKVLMDLAGRSLLERTLQRCRAILRIDSLVVATTTLTQDDCIAQEARRLGVGVFRGSESDVLSRYLGAAHESDAEAVVRVTSDCPFLDPEVSSRVVAAFGPGVDYVSNTIRRTFPRGLDTEIVATRVLERIAGATSEERYREHVTLYVNEHENEFSRGCVENDEDWSAYRWTVDTAADLAFARAVYANMGDVIWPTRELVRFLQSHPEILALNADVKQKEV